MNLADDENEVAILRLLDGVLREESARRTLDAIPTATSV